MSRIFSYSFIFLVALVFAQCRFFSKKKDYSKLPEDTANYLRWNDALAEDSNNADLLNKRAEYLLGKKYYIKALADAYRATGIDTTNARYFFVLGNICFAVNKTKAASVAYERAVTLDKDYYEAYLKLGELYLYVKEHEQSLKNYDEALRIQPNCDRCYFYKGMNFREMYKIRDHNKLAIEQFQKATAINPDNFDAYIQLGELNDSIKPALALEYYNAAVRLKPKSVEALYHRAYHYQVHNQFDSAGADYKRITELNPDFMNAYFNVAWINMQQKKWQTAIDGYKVVVKIDPSNAGAWYNTGLCYEQLGNRIKAIEAYRECIKIDPGYLNAKERIEKLK
jgi:tetratricopeptide (TPR) repeat protein